jgi:hypothetical protein
MKEGEKINYQGSSDSYELMYKNMVIIATFASHSEILGFFMQLHILETTKQSHQ